MKIALICTEKLPVPPVAGGAIQMYIEGILPYLSPHHDITVFCIQHPGLPEEEVRENVRYIRVSGKSQTAYIQNIAESIAASVDKDGTPFELIHVFNRPKFFLALSERFPGSRFGLSLHNEMMHAEKISDDAGLKCIEKAEFINAVSRYIAGTVTRRFPAAETKMRVVYSGVDPKKYDPPWTEAGAAKKLEIKSKYGLQDYRVVLYVGRLSIKKGVHILINAMEKVMQTHPDTALVIAGSKWYGSNAGDEYTDSIRKLVLKLPGPVVFTGFIPPSDIAGYYCLGDIFVCASQWNEPLARVHYEAMAAGIPIITTDRGGNAEVVCGTDAAAAANAANPAGTAGGCGIVIDQYNDPAVFADKIRFLLDNPGVASSMGRKGRQLAEEKYNWKRVASEIFPFTGHDISRADMQQVNVHPDTGTGMFREGQVQVAARKPSADNPAVTANISSYAAALTDENVQTADAMPAAASSQAAITHIADSSPLSGTTPAADIPPAGANAHTADISVIGTGYVGLVTGACLASMGRNVICCDQDRKKIRDLSNGIVPIYEPSLKELVDNGIREKRLSFTDDIRQAVGHSDIIFITVNTPTLPDGSCDTGNVFEAARSIGTCMDRYKVIVNKSTVPVGTGKNIKQVISAMLSIRGLEIGFDVLSNPEFLREGSAVHDFMNPDRIVIGAENPRAVYVLKDVYSKHMAENIPFLVTDIETAEMIKYASNAFLAAKISFVNELSNLCEKCGVDISDVTCGMGLDSRIGPHFLNPGPGFGGSCFPKDVKALLALSKKYGLRPLLLQSVLDVNEAQKRRMADKIESALGRLNGCRIAVLGLSFKPGTDDIRESPAVSVISSLLERNAAVAVYDPRAMENMKREHPEMAIEYCSDIYSACSGSDCIVLATEWKEFSDLDFGKLRSIVRRPVFIDLRNVYDPKNVKSSGFHYEGVGRK